MVLLLSPRPLCQVTAYVPTLGAYSDTFGITQRGDSGEVTNHKKAMTLSGALDFGVSHYKRQS